MKYTTFIKISILFFVLNFCQLHANERNRDFRTNSIITSNDTLKSNKKSSTKAAFVIDPPKISATGNQIYCPQTNIKIVETFDIDHDPLEIGTEAGYIQISSGYSNGSDKLELSNPASHPNVLSNWDPLTGKLKLTNLGGGNISYTDLEAAVEDVIFSNSSLTDSGTRTFSITIGQANYLPSTQHYYLFVPSIGITWTQAKKAAEESTYYGLKGYLATLLTQEEAILSGKQATGAGWIGGSDTQTEGVWKWVTGPEAGTTMSYTFWNTGEPNNAGEEDYAHITSNVGITGSWNDLSDTGSPSGDYQPKGYVVEFGGMPGELPLQIAASTQITIPIITNTTTGKTCDSGTVTLTATASAGTISWYDTSTGGTALQTGTTFITPIINTTTTYYVDAGCEINRKPVIATVNYTPDTPTVTSSTVSRCGSGTVTIEANSNIGNINWFTTATGGSSVFNGKIFNTPSITQNTTFYAESYNDICVNPTRVPVEVIIYTPPVVTNEEVILCQSHTKILDAKITGVAYLWSTKETTQTIEVSTPGTYTVVVTSPAPESCPSTKTIEVILHEIPVINKIQVDERSVTINLANPKDYYEYSVDGENYQDSNVFYNVPGGLQMAYVKEKNGCDGATQNFVVLVFPPFFTPNNDNHNDSWEVIGMEFFPQAQVTIFDRYGKLLAQLNAAKKSWDGTFNKSPLPASDYWYSINIDNTLPVMKGHFSLKR
jgi:gliding motility-associated-like protein